MIFKSFVVLQEGDRSILALDLPGHGDTEATQSVAVCSIIFLGVKHVIFCMI